MQTSEKAKEFIRSYESFRAMSYKDSGNKSTIGYGHLILPTDPDYGDGITQQAALALFDIDLFTKAEEPVLNSVRINVSQQEFDALCSLCYNIGAGNFGKSHLVQYLNEQKSLRLIADQFLLWDHVGGVVSKGLHARRVAERDIFLKGLYINH